ncbi:MAG: hypothetical protein LBE65_03500, partial [Synergistaceae bacterium]|nr:hypothetical protein [Synergistaceae bacterium]
VVDVREGPSEPNEPGGGGCDTGASGILPLFAAAALLYRRRKA